MHKPEVTVHLTYEFKFIPGFIENLKILDLLENNHFLYIGSGTKNTHIHEVGSVQEAQDFIQKIQPTRVVVHFLKADFYKVIYTLPQEVTVAWIFYGAEFYNRGEVYLDQLFPIQKKRFYATYKSILNYANLKSQQCTYFLYKVFRYKAPFYRALTRVNYFVHWMEEDYKNVVKKYKLKHLSFVPFYYSTPIPIGKFGENPRNLLIGNSGAFTNNHLEVIERLEPAFIGQFDKVILPISYGCTHKYEQLIRKACARFGDKVVILSSFMDKDEYFALLKSVKLAIYASRRSQAGNNIRWAFHHGIDVALHPDNAMYRFYMDHGLQIHTLDNSFYSQKTDFLSEEVRSVNSVTIAQLLGHKMREDSFNGLLNTK